MDTGAATVGRVSTSLPMFPLNAVVFPGVSVPLQVFEDRYRALVHHPVSYTHLTLPTNREV